jgi:hypothetical protein
MIHSSTNFTTEALRTHRDTEGSVSPWDLWVSVVIVHFSSILFLRFTYV